MVYLTFLEMWRYRPTFLAVYIRLLNDMEHADEAL